MIAAEKEAASGSLFLQQPVREDFKEEDLFENGKGFVRRFNIGEKNVILVGLGADAMTEEGYKWACEKFNSDKDASGILLVNNYLLEDMRKPDKIDERALDLEKNVVKACSNVRMVLSSSGGYQPLRVLLRRAQGDRHQLGHRSSSQGGLLHAAHLQRGSQHPQRHQPLPVHLRLRV